MGQKTGASGEAAQTAATGAAAEPAEAAGADGKRLELSITQVAGSSLATIAAAYLASKMGVYGTILGAGVVSVVATAGGPVIQHFFKRTGETIREGGEAVRPKARQVPAAPDPAEDRTRLLPAVDGTQVLPAVDGTQVLPAADRTRLLPAADAGFGAASTHGTRVRGWRAKALAAALVFGVSMGGIAVYEQVSGNSSTFGGVTTGGTQHHKKDPVQEEGRPTPDGGDRTRSHQPDPDPSRSGGGKPTPSPSHSTDPAPSPTPPDPTPTPTPPTPTPTPPTPTPHGSTGADGGADAGAGTGQGGSSGAAGTG